VGLVHCGRVELGADATRGEAPGVLAGAGTERKRKAGEAGAARGRAVACRVVGHKALGRQWAVRAGPCGESGESGDCGDSGESGRAGRAVAGSSRRVGSSSVPSRSSLLVEVGMEMVAVAVGTRVVTGTGTGAVTEMTTAAVTGMETIVMVIEQQTNNNGDKGYGGRRLRRRRR